MLSVNTAEMPEPRLRTRERPDAHHSSPSGPSPGRQTCPCSLRVPLCLSTGSLAQHVICTLFSFLDDSSPRVACLHLRGQVSGTRRQSPFSIIS